MIVAAALLLAAPTASPVELSASRAAQAVVMLHAGAEQPGVGTAFLVTHEGVLFLVTAEHVVQELGDALVTFGTGADLATTMELRALVGEEAVEWVVHGTADVAVVKLAGWTRPELLHRAISSDHLVSVLEAPPRERFLLTLGFPVGLGGRDLGPDGRISPISSESKAASGLLTFPRYDTDQASDFFLLDKPSIEGFSGGPVFMPSGPVVRSNFIGFGEPGTFCVGIVHGTVGTASGGMAAIVPAAYVRETIFKAWLRHRPFTLGGPVLPRGSARPFETSSATDSGRADAE